jgi:hypothetical protein
MTIITEAVLSGEADLLLGNEKKKLYITSLCGDKVLVEIHPPLTGFTHEILKDIDKGLDFPEGYDVHLGEVWVGSSEI